MRFRTDWVFWVGLIAGLVLSVSLIVSGLERRDTLPILIGVVAFVGTMLGLSRRR